MLACLADFALNIGLPDHSFAHLIYFLSASLCAYNFFRAITLDAGSCPRPGSESEMKSVSLHLWRYLALIRVCPTDMFTLVDH